MEIVHNLHVGLGSAAAFIKLILESISVLCVALGLVATLVMVFKTFFCTGSFISNPHAVRLKFGTWLGMALEFQLGADIVATTVNPTLQSLIELAILAAVRTFLNFFLQKELEAVERLAPRMLESMATTEIRGPDNPESA